MTEIKTKQIRISNADLSDAMEFLGTFTATELKDELEYRLQFDIDTSTVRRRLNMLVNTIDPDTDCGAIQKTKVNSIVYFTASTNQCFKIKSNADFLKKKTRKSNHAYYEISRKKKAKVKMQRWGERFRGAPGDIVMMIGI